MTKITYELAVINGIVCYACQPSTAHAFYYQGSWYAPFCTVLEFTRRKSAAVHA